MTSLGKLASGAGVIGTVVLGAVTHDNPLLVSAVALAVAGIGILVWILSSDRRVERLNVLLRGAPLPTFDAEPGRPEADLIARLRKAGYSELADELEHGLAQRTSEAGRRPTVAGQQLDEPR